MKYPINKYKFASHIRKDGRREVIAISSFAGKTVRGRAILDEKDTFNMEVGKKLAALRCAEAIGIKRVKRATACLDCADEYLEEALAFKDKMGHYYDDAQCELVAVREELDALMTKLMDD